MNENYGYISEFMSGGRILSHGKITSLTGGFKLPGEQPFTIYVRPKTTVSGSDILISVKCYSEELTSEAPFPYGDWSPLAIREIAPSETLLSNVDIYWGCGDKL